MMCRLTMKPQYVIGQPISAVIEIKNVSEKKRFIIRYLEPRHRQFVHIAILGPKAKFPPGRAFVQDDVHPTQFQLIEPGEVKRVDVADLGSVYKDLAVFVTRPARAMNDVAIGRYDLNLRFRSPKIPKSYKSGQKVIETPEQVLDGEWAGEIESAPVSFELLPLTKEDLVVHEWGVFTILNDSKYANANRKEEWGSLPSFFYRQFPIERIRWFPSEWDKPIIYIYSKPELMHLSVKVTFPEGAPVVWWPCAAEPMDNSPGPQLLPNSKPYRSLTWDAWLGHYTRKVVKNWFLPGDPPLVKVDDFPLSDGCWLQHARLSSASHISVVGNDPKWAKAPGQQDRLETERFIYYDGLVPTPDYLHCEHHDENSITLRNGAQFDLRHLFIVDLRSKDRIGFAYLDGVMQPFKAGTTQTIKPHPVAVADWPATGVTQVRKALLEAGLFEPEAEVVLKLWHKQFFEESGLVAFHILPVEEYDRMLPLDILPRPVEKPVRVGIALHPNLQIEPKLAERARLLLKQLGSAKFQEREAASKGLLEIGPVAIGLIRAELNKDIALETRRRLESVIDRVDATEWLNLKDSVKK